MFAFCTSQPQLALPVGHLASVWNTIRSASQTVARTQTRQGQQHVTASVTADDFPVNQHELTNGVKETLNELGLSELAKHVKVELLNPVLQPSLRTDTCHHHIEPSYISAESFFTNKHGHTLQELLHPSPPVLKISFPLLSTSGSLLTSHWMPQSFNQPRRGFQTVRQRKSYGLGSEAPKHTKVMDFVRGSIFKSVSSKEHANDKVRNLLEDPQLDPAVQEKIKISFAEGYLAGQEIPPKTGVLPSYLFRVLRTFTIILVVMMVMIVTLRFIPVYFTNTRLSNMLGEIGHTVKIEEVQERFGDVRGADEVKEELKDVVEFLRNPDKFTALGAKLPKGVLLCGPPGVGKTLLARAVAGEADVPFIYASGAEFDEVYVGVGAKKIRELFNDAKSRAPCVIFLDEIDTVGAKRTNSEAHPYANQTINQLLTEMDGFKQNEGIIILGATNRRDHLDPALMRAGRFDMEIYMHPPDYNGRKEIFDLYLGKVKAGPDISLDKLARATTGFNGADIANLVNQAAIIAALRNDTCVTMAHLEFAREKITMGPVKKKRIPDEETNRVTAFHEAGHAIVAYFSKDATSPHKITIMPRGQALGHTAFIPEKDQYNLTRNQLFAEMDVALGGRVAEELIFGSDKITTGAGSDFEKANRIAEAVVKKLGMSEKAGLRIIEDKDFMGKPHPEYSSATLEIVDNEIKRLLQESYERCRQILKSHSKELKELAEALLKYETLDEEEIRMILDGKKFVKKIPKPSGSSQPVIGQKSNKKAIKALIEGTKLTSGSSTPESSGRDT